MRIKQKVIKGVETILADQSQLEIADAAKLMMLASYDDLGHINAEGLQALNYIGQHYQNNMSGLCNIVFQEMLNSIPENPNVFVPDGGKVVPAKPPQQKPKSNSPSRPAPAKPKPAPAPAPTVNRDLRLVGVWEYSKYTSAGGFSISSSRARAFRSDGRFFESSGSYVNLIQRNSQGDEAGRTYADSVSPDERGTWKTDKSILRLDWDNNYYAVYKYELGREGMLLTQIDPPGGEAKYWEKKS